MIFPVINAEFAVADERTMMKISCASVLL